MCVRGSWRPNRTATYWPPLLWPSALCLSSSPDAQPEARGPAFCWVLAFSTTSCLQLGWSPKLTDFLSSPSCIIVQSPTQYLPITGHRDVSLPLSLGWHVWLSSGGNNCHAVHRSVKRYPLTPTTLSQSSNHVTSYAGRWSTSGWGGNAHFSTYTRIRSRETGENRKTNEQTWGYQEQKRGIATLHAYADYR